MSIALLLFALRCHCYWDMQDMCDEAIWHVPNFSLCGRCRRLYICGSYSKWLCRWRNFCPKKISFSSPPCSDLVSASTWYATFQSVTERIRLVLIFLIFSLFRPKQEHQWIMWRGILRMTNLLQVGQIKFVCWWMILTSTMMTLVTMITKISTISNRTRATIAWRREKIRVRNATNTYHHEHTIAQYVSNAFANVIITAFGWIAALVNRIIVYSFLVVVWEHSHFCSAQTYRLRQFAIHFLCFDCSALIYWCRTIAAKYTISMSRFQFTHHN